MWLGMVWYRKCSMVLDVAKWWPPHAPQVGVGLVAVRGIMVIVEPPRIFKPQKHPFQVPSIVPATAM